MCGGYTIAKEIQKLEARFEAELEGRFGPRYNARPGQILPVITAENPHKIVPAHWGLKPPWLEKMGLHKELINTRVESALKPSFKGYLRHHRCLVLADGFLEWERAEKVKIPHRYGIQGFAPFAMAGLYQLDADGMLRFSIITTSANKTVSAIHDRMPVILLKQNEGSWLGQYEHAENYLPLLKPYPDENFEDLVVSAKINSSANDSEDLLLP